MGVQPPAELDIVDYIAQTRDSYRALGFDAYRWAHNPDPVPLRSPTRPVRSSRVALVASGGVYRVGDVGFTHKDDTSHREIPVDTPTGEIRVTHFAYDQTDARRDPNVVFPIEPLRTLAANNEIGGLTDVALTFMGGIYSQRRLAEELTPVLVRRLHELGTDIALLVPV